MWIKYQTGYKRFAIIKYLRCEQRAKEHLTNTLNIYIFVCGCMMCASSMSLIALQTQATKVGLDGYSGLSSEITKENIQYGDNFKPTNNHVSGKHEF